MKEVIGIYIKYIIFMNVNGLKIFFVDYAADQQRIVLLQFLEELAWN